MLTRKTATLAVAAILIALAGSCLRAGAPDAKAPEGKTVEMSVTENGFEPTEVKVKKGEPVTLVVTRKTDKTCATEIVIAEEKINVALPLNKAVRVTFTPQKTGDIRYACGMNMYGGVLKVE